MGQYDEIDANVQFNAWLDARILNAKRAVDHYDANLCPGEEKKFSSRFLDPAYRIGHGGRGVYDAALKYDNTAALQGGVEAGFPPYSQVDVHARMISEQDPNYWIQRRLKYQYPEFDPSLPLTESEQRVWFNPEKHRDQIDRLKRIEENVEGLTARQKAIASIRSEDPGMHNLASLIEGGAGQLSVAEIQKLDMEAQIANLRKYGATEAQIKPLLDRLKIADSPEMQAGVKRLTGNVYDGLTIWGREMQRRGLTAGEFIPNPETKISIGLVPNKYRGMGPKVGALGKAGGFLLGLGGIAGELGMISRVLKGGEFMQSGNNVDVVLPSELIEKDGQTYIKEEYDAYIDQMAAFHPDNAANHPEITDEMRRKFYKAKGIKFDE
ncbi:MAG: hypothetical protein EB127_03470 [Alphaproteobacteria bacterium]|nr:hypothetical protein [Alphaproteobacteria bacterium]